jgi:outer membrane protein TolC
MIRALLSGALACALTAQVQGPASTPPLTYEALLSRATSDPTQLRLEADLAARQRQLAATGGLLREAPTLTAEAGRRSGPGTSSTDKVAQVDAPLLLAPTLRAGARDSLDRAEGSLLALARAEARHRLRLAYLDAWLAEAQLRLRSSQLDLTETWVKVAQARVESGSDPAYQADLVRGDLLRLRSDLGEAQRRAAEAWGALRALTDLPAEPLPLADPGAPALPGPEGLSEAFQRSLMRRALADRTAADRTAFDLQQALKGSRWSLRGSHASEGDERITRLGVAFRLPRPGELSAQKREASAGRGALAREGEAAAYQLESRFQTALTRLRTFGDVLPPRRFDAALLAVDLRLREGKERPSDALLLRRQLLEADSASLQRLRDAHALAAELDLLTLGDAR